MTDKEETQTFCEYICIKSHIMYYGQYPSFATYQEGASYWFHEDKPVSAAYFLPVIDSEGFPVVKICRVEAVR